jgi:hypothetical protein
MARDHESGNDGLPNSAASRQLKFPATFLAGSLPFIGNKATSTANGLTYQPFHQTKVYRRCDKWHDPKFNYISHEFAIPFSSLSISLCFAGIPWKVNSSTDIDCRR